MSLSKIIRNCEIPQIRQITTNIIAGPTLETQPKTLSALKQNGITTIVDFRGGVQPLIENACSQTGLNYLNIDFNHAISSGKKVFNAPENFLEQLKQFFKIMDRGHAYIGCQYGVHRTNAALVYNHVLNNPRGSKFPVPEILRLEGDGSTNNIINFLFRKIWKTVKHMTPQDKISFNLPNEKTEIYQQFIQKKAGEVKNHVNYFI